MAVHEHQFPEEETPAGVRLLLPCLGCLMPAADAMTRCAAERDAAVQLIWRVVTGDGAQQENLDMADDEWDAFLVEGGDAREHFPITLRFEDWMAMVRIARTVNT